MSNVSSFADVEDNDGSVYLDPGIHTVKFLGCTWETPQTKKPYANFRFGGGAGTTDQRFYLQGGDNTKISLESIKHIAKHLVDKSELEKLTWPEGDHAAMCEKLDALLSKEKDVEIKLVGEEYNGRILGKFGYKPFIQNVGDQTLKFNPDTDIKREAKPDISSVGAGAMPPPAAPPAAAGTPPGAAPAPTIPGM